MSDILIKNMKMPENCMDCPFRGFDRACGRGNLCTINELITLHAVLDGVDVKFVRMGDCPLVEVPTPHGDLIDRDKATEKLAELSENIEAKLGFECSASYTLASLFLQNKKVFPTIVKGDET